jgi:hypothetical protein
MRSSQKGNKRILDSSLNIAIQALVFKMQCSFALKVVESKKRKQGWKATPRKENYLE